MKLQGSAASEPKTLHSQICQSAQNRILINALDVVHGRLTNESAHQSRSIRKRRTTMLTKIMTTVAAVLIAATTAQAAAVVHKHQSRSDLTNDTAMAAEKARASMALMRAIPSDQTPTSTDSNAPECGIAAETDATPSGPIPCNPKNIATTPKMMGEKARASMALMPAAATPTGVDHLSRYRNGAMSAPAGH
jgi:cytoskeletal protein RodZ